MDNHKDKIKITAKKCFKISFFVFLFFFSDFDSYFFFFLERLFAPYTFGFLVPPRPLIRFTIDCVLFRTFVRFKYYPFRYVRFSLSKYRLFCTLFRIIASGFCSQTQKTIKTQLKCVYLRILLYYRLYYLIAILLNNTIYYDNIIISVVYIYLT